MNDFIIFFAGATRCLDSRLPRFPFGTVPSISVGSPLTAWQTIRSGWLGAHRRGRGCWSGGRTDDGDADGSEGGAFESFVWLFTVSPTSSATTRNFISGRVANLPQFPTPYDFPPTRRKCLRLCVPYHWITVTRQQFHSIVKPCCATCWSSGQESQRFACTATCEQSRSTVSFYNWLVEIEVVRLVLTMHSQAVRTEAYRDCLPWSSLGQTSKAT